MQDRQLIADNLARVQDEIESRAREANRPLSDVTLCAVSKTFPADIFAGRSLRTTRLWGESRPGSRAKMAGIEG